MPDNFGLNTNTQNQHFAAEIPLPTTLPQEQITRVPSSITEQIDFKGKVQSYLVDTGSSVTLQDALTYIAEGETIAKALVNGPDPPPHPDNPSKLCWYFMGRSIASNQPFLRGTMRIVPDSPSDGKVGDKIVKHIIECSTENVEGKTKKNYYSRVSSHFNERTNGKQYGLDDAGKIPLPGNTKTLLFAKLNDGEECFLKMEFKGLCIKPILSVWDSSRSHMRTFEKTKEAFHHLVNWIKHSTQGGVETAKFKSRRETDFIKDIKDCYTQTLKAALNNNSIDKREYNKLVKEGKTFGIDRMTKNVHSTINGSKGASDEQIMFLARYNHILGMNNLTSNPQYERKGHEVILSMPPQQKTQS